MTRPEGLIELPNGDCIWYDDDSHRYSQARFDERKNEWVRSTRLTGASTLSKPFSYDSGRLLNWKERVTCEGIAELLKEARDPDYWTSSASMAFHTGEGIRAKLKEASLLADDARDRKATIGTNVHSVLEGLAGVGPLPNVDDIPEEEAGYARAVFKWWEERRPEVLNAEQFVYSAEHGFAGRFDLRCRLREDVPQPLPYVALLDLKTSGWIGPSHHVQLALYELAARECGVGPSDEQLILKVKEDGTWEEIPCKATEDDALAAIAVYRGAARIERKAA